MSLLCNTSVTDKDDAKKFIDLLKNLWDDNVKSQEAQSMLILAGVDAGVLIEQLADKHIISTHMSEEQRCINPNVKNPVDRRLTKIKTKFVQIECKGIVINLIISSHLDKDMVYSYIITEMGIDINI